MTSAAEPAGAGPVDEALRVRPAPALRPYVAWYSGYRQRGVDPAVHHGLPSPHLTLILTLDEPLHLAGHPDPAQPPGSYRTLLGGLHTSPALITHDGCQSGVQVALGPLGARALLGLPAGELAGWDFPADEVLGRCAAEGQERLRAAADWPGRFAAVDRWLTERLAAHLSGRASAARPPAPEVVQAWRLLLAGAGRPGAPTVAALADEVGWSGRHLAARFRSEIGLTPKAAARVIRFDRARRLLTARAAAAGGGSAGGVGSAGLAELAADCGYFDQAHLAREFRALAGSPPSRWLAQEGGRAGAAARPGSETSKPGGGGDAQAGGVPG
ncbi:helix-turn-helix domain-containing protein [Kitasatospora sp. LaBMicrA B282]|uniref:helix-turn-helix domain-containing protein n=1 Tax=Kitasatospora sp. LaBMicrA B282 TaxID=3420949 RepID=UPI003D151E3A